jgi:hypothetical protein
MGDTHAGEWATPTLVNTEIRKAKEHFNPAASFEFEWEHPHWKNTLASVTTENYPGLPGVLLRFKTAHLYPRSNP